MARVGAPELAGLLALHLLAGGCLDWSKVEGSGDAGLRDTDALDGNQPEGDASARGDGQVNEGDDASQVDDASGQDATLVDPDGATATTDAGKPLPACGPGPCQHGACSSDGQRCECPPTYTGATCSDDVNECANATQACPPDNFMPCLNTQGGYTCLGQLADWPIPSATRPSSELVVHPDGSTTTDTVTGLMWERMAPPTLYSILENDAYCRDLRLGSYADWRVPALIEYMSLFTREPFPGNPGDALATGLSGLYYTNTANADGAGFWCVRMETGFAELCPEAALFSAVIPMRCVRTATVKFIGRPSERYVVDNDLGLVKDTRTGLLFERQSESSPRTFAAAEQHCKSNTRAGRSWRLPTAVELMSTIDALLAPPAASRVFLGAYASTWSSTTKLGNAGMHVCVDLQSSQAGAYADDGTNCVTRCVSQ